MRTLSRKRAILFRSLLLTITALVSLLALELTARIWREINSPAFYHESVSTNLDYRDTWRKGGLGPGGFLAENFDDYVIDGYGKAVRWRTNSYGFRNAYPINTQPSAGTVRILSIGDSFTAGYRLDQTETFSYLLEEYLHQRQPGTKYQVLISCIEDPVSGLFYLQERGGAFRPQMLLLGITLGNDIAQSYIGLGAEGAYLMDDLSFRVRPNESFDRQALKRLDRMLMPESDLISHDRSPHVLHSQPLLAQNSALYASLFAPYAGESVVTGWPNGKEHPRLFSPTNSLGQYMIHPPAAVEQSFARLFQVLLGYQKLAAEYRTELVVVLFPQRFQVQPPDWQATVRDYRLDAARFDVNLPNRRILAFCAEQGISCLDPTPAMRQAFLRDERSLYLPRGDMHWNSRGSRSLYETIREDVYQATKK